ncbi:hypothetical protein GUJ93_ZPchr0014g46505 [Zizania palustris]|uniref:Uncharacterized protein n=1 Tax=Zizania palustris TaxID=103762 RepID=A0A8J5TAP5_ZIZPA|nr:hypothetical protein GUJ93_ZPchr0014g46505 [Zizania palustris]
MCPRRVGVPAPLCSCHRMASALGSSARKVDRRGGCGGSGSHFPVLPCRFVHSPPRRGAGAGVTCAWRLKFRAARPPRVTSPPLPRRPLTHTSIHPSTRRRPYRTRTPHATFYPLRPRRVMSAGFLLADLPRRVAAVRGAAEWITTGGAEGSNLPWDCNGSSRSTVMQQEHAHDLCSENVVQKASSWPLTSSDERIISLHSRAREWASDDLDRIEVHMDEIEMKK